MKVKAGFSFCTNGSDAGKDQETPADVVVRTSDGQSILVHSSVLAAASPVLKRKIDKAKRSWNSVHTIQILGAPSDAVIAFVQLLCSTRESNALTTAEIAYILEKHSMQLLALSHAYQIRWLKKRCEITIATELTPDRAIDVAKISKMFDAPRLYQQCIKLVVKDFAEVRRSDGWRFVRRHDPALELEMLQILEETDERKRKWKQQRAAQQSYQQLSEAMDCLEHIFTEGCTEVGPRNANLSKRNKGRCTWFDTCRGLQLLLRHFSACDKKLAPGGCPHCQRAGQLLHLHSSICDRSDSCKVPLCNDDRFGMKMQREGRSDKTWRLLVERVCRTRILSAVVRRKTPEDVCLEHGHNIGQWKMKYLI